MRIFLHKLKAWVQVWRHQLRHACTSALQRAEGLRVEVDLGGITITARELTVMDVRNWLKALGNARDFDLVDSFLFEAQEVTVSDLVLMSDASRATIESLPPSLLVKLAQAVKEANPFFFQFRQTLQRLAKLPDNG